MKTHSGDGLLRQVFVLPAGSEGEVLGKPIRATRTGRRRKFMLNGLLKLSGSSVGRERRRLSHRPAP